MGSMTNIQIPAFYVRRVEPFATITTTISIFLDETAVISSIVNDRLRNEMTVRGIPRQ